jgi:hypothetical protein
MVKTTEAQLREAGDYALMWRAYESLENLYVCSDWDTKCPEERGLISKASAVLDELVDYLVRVSEGEQS